jgi:ribosome-binding protein aMBF1 (putative translation factor)
LIRAVQLRMARAALGWSLNELAEKAKVHLNTVRRCELGHEAMMGTMQKIEAVLRKEGIVFLEETGEDGPGIRMTQASDSASTSAPTKRKTTKTKK